ncbi:MAG: DUF3999 domain-containing protein [Dokdonella sp.]|nr:MAG: DUF3999 domain-containing protein [Dokdonella sp.]
MKVWLTMLLGAGLALPAHAARTPRDYAWLYPLELPAAATDNAWRVELTPAVYAHVHDPTLRDIAVFNGDGQLVPFARESPEPALTPREIVTAVPVLVLPASEPAGTATDLHLLIERDGEGRLRRLETSEQVAPAAAAEARDWVLDASGIHGSLESITLTWAAPAGDLVARFSISASDDLQAWRPVGGGSVFALQQGEARLDRRELGLGTLRARYLLLQRVDTGAQLQGLQARIRYSVRAPGGAALEWVDAQAVAPPVVAAPRGDSADGSTFDYVLPAALPIEQVRIELAGDNSVAAIDILALDKAGAKATSLAQTTAFGLTVEGETLRNDATAVNPAARVGRLRVHARTPLAAAPRVQVGFRPDRFVFLAEGKPPYSLVVGSASARLPDYPVDAALARLRAQLGAQWQPPLAHIGAGVPSGGDSVLKAPPVPISWQRWLLWLTLVGGAVLVAGLALGMLRGERK